MSSTLSIYKCLRRYPGRIALGILTLILVDGAQVFIPWTLRRAIDSARLGQISILSHSVYTIFALAAFVFIFRIFWRYFLFGSARKIRRDIRCDIYTHLTKLPADFFSRTSSGEILALASNDIEAINMACGFGIMVFIDALFFGVFATLAMFKINFALALIVLMPVPIIIIYTLWAGAIVRKRFDQVQNVFAVLTEKAREVISGMRVVKAYAQEASFAYDFAESNQQYVTRNIELLKVSNWFDPLITLLMGICTMLSFYFSSRQIIEGNISVGDFVALNAYLAMLSWPVIAIGVAISIMQKGQASCRRIGKILAERPKQVSAKGTAKILDTTLRISNLNFDFNSRSVLKAINLELKVGETMGLIGLNASGKSTLANLILRVYEPEPGTISLGGRDILQYDLDELHKNIILAPQEPLLFSMSIEENITFGEVNADRLKVEEVCRIAGILEEINNFPQTFKTLVGERGVLLSGGQKQRIALARALFANPRILIMDDALAAVDTAQEEVILKNIINYLKNSSLIIISNRVSALARMHKVLTLDKGSIIEQGNHAQLIAQNGLYAKLYRLQRLSV